MVSKIEGPVVVIGATGAQGGAVAKALLAAGRPVHALVRQPSSGPALALKAAGATLVTGDMDDRASLDRALDGAAAVFSVQVPPTGDDPELEVRTGTKLVDAAFSAGVRMFVHTSVARAGDQTSFAPWSGGDGKWAAGYWTSKSAVNDTVKAKGFAHYVILKPAFLMENFAAPRAQFMFPGLESGRLVTAIRPDRPLDLIAAGDIGMFTAAALDDPEKFDRAEIDLAAESLTMVQIADALSRGTGRNVVAESLSPEDAVSRGLREGVVQSQDWNNVEGYKVDVARLHAWGVPLQSFNDWIVDNQYRVMVP